MTTANDFFENLVRWRGWCAEMIPSAEEWIKEGQARPGMKFDYNLFRHADGSVWGFGPNDSWIRMTRQGQGRWLKTDEVRSDLSRESLIRCQKGDDWAWFFDDGEFGSKFDTCYYWKSSRDLALRGMAFADALLSQRAAIEAWANEFAAGMDRSNPRCLDGDFRALVESFCPHVNANDPDVPDYGSLLCMLHAWLDTISGYTQRSYGC